MFTMLFIVGIFNFLARNCGSSARYEGKCEQNMDLIVIIVQCS